MLEVAIFYFLLALEAEKLVGQQISNPVQGKEKLVSTKRLEWEIRGERVKVLR